MEEAPSYGSSHSGLKKLVPTSPTAWVSLFRSQAGALQSNCQTESWGRWGYRRESFGGDGDRASSYPTPVMEVLRAATAAAEHGQPPTPVLSSKDN